ncbi:MAG: hypothetical protein KAR42_15030 [candidate division Zixibacteria bacterium]|nr:hypothetical protein [candidate division Zixibacteria bacterium]
MASDPAIVACPEGEWTLVAETVTSGNIWIKDTRAQYSQTYRLTGEAAPTLFDEAVLVSSPGDCIRATEAIDVYIWCQKNAGSVRVDV